MSDDLRFAVLGAGFWARFQLAGWKEAGGARCVAIYNRTRSKAEAVAKEFGIPSVYEDAEDLLKNEKLDFVDIITDVNTHSRFVRLAAKYKLPTVCQKPMAPSYEIARQMVQASSDAGVPLLINENWRWQTPIRQLHSVLEAGAIGRPFRARLDMISGFAVFANQPFLKELDQFILTDLGSHLLDAARFLFGEPERLYCQTRRVHNDIQGEDTATVMMRMGEGTTVLVQLAYAENFLERECFPQTLIFVEGERGSVELCPDYRIRVTTKTGTHASRHPPPRYAWADPAYDVVHSSIVSCQANLVKSLRGIELAETAAEDNLKSMRLVFDCYESAREGKVIHYE